MPSAISASRRGSAAATSSSSLARARCFHGRNDAAARPRDLFVARTRKPHLEFAGAVAGIDQMRVAIDQARRDPAALAIDALGGVEMRRVRPRRRHKTIVPSAAATMPRSTSPGRSRCQRREAVRYAKPCRSAWISRNNPLGGAGANVSYGCRDEVCNGDAMLWFETALLAERLGCAMFGSNRVTASSRVSKLGRPSSRRRAPRCRHSRALQRAQPRLPARHGRAWPKRADRQATISGRGAR